MIYTLDLYQCTLCMHAQGFILHAMKDKNSQNSYSTGDKIVHNYHGVGVVMELENMAIGGEEKLYYRIRTPDDTVIWVPTNEEGFLRKVAPPEVFKNRVTDILQRPSKKMSSAFQTRIAKIRKARDEGSPQALARIVRDLMGRRVRKGRLSTTEQQELNTVMDKLQAEWAASVGKEESQARDKIFSLLKPEGAAAD